MAVAIKNAKYINNTCIKWGPFTVRSSYLTRTLN